mmetsp:Transcript_29866/g.74068  ORF Transcript_29866/g.74068 Transcript_29866/m.74068 type:complete len:953 (+) Transcript_29866:90-2948(+)
MKLAACSVDFNVGFFSDQGFEGISHFLEHMVFMGSEKYPGENHFSDWLSKHWGSENACTDSEQTTFYFECHPKHLKEGLDVFSGYFLNPLLKMDAVEREVTAVESEFERVVNNDGSRLEAIMAHTAKDAHPFRVFGWGNRASLTDSEQWKQGKIRDALMEHWRRHYHARRMSLVLLGEQDLDTLQGWVAELFGDMRSDGDDKPDYSTAGLPYGDQLPLMVHAGQVREGKQLDLVFTVPAEIKRSYRAKSVEYVEELIGHEGHGSLFATLKAKGLAERIMAGVGAGGLSDTSNCALFTATIKLTDEGFERIDEVISLFFQYVEMLRRTGPQEWSWLENKALRGIEFRFKEEEGAADYTESLAMTMRRYGHRDCLQGDYIYDEYKPDEIVSLLSHVAPRTCLYILSDHGFDVEAPGVECERWFKVPFKREPLDAATLAAWEAAEPEAALQYPPRNHYIAEKFEIKGGSKSRVAAAIVAGMGAEAAAAAPAALVTPPEIIHECGAMRLWHRLDDKFDQPRMNAYFHVTLPAIEATPEAYVMADLLTLLVHDRLQDGVRYPAEMASLNAGLDVVGQFTMLSLVFDGFNDKLPKLVEAYFNALANFEVSESRFQKMKEERVKGYRNHGLKPGRQARSLLYQTLMERNAGELDKLAALEKITVGMMRDFAAAVWGAAAHVEGLVIGNVTAEEALGLGEMIRKTLKGAPIAPDAFPTRRITVIPPGDARFAIACQNPEESTNVVYSYFQLGVSTYHMRAMLLLVQQLMGEKLFDQLRTKEQLGYVANASLETLYDIAGFRITVESAFHPPAYVEERINAFLSAYPAQVAALKEDEFTKTRRSLVDSVLTIDVSLTAEADRHWTHINNQRYQYYRGQIIASEINKISRDQVVEWLKHNLVPEHPKARHITVFVHGKNHPLNVTAETIVAAAATAATAPSGTLCSPASSSSYPPGAANRSL